MMRARTGVTLIELLITVVVLGVMSAVCTLAVRRIDRPPADDPASTIADSLTAAIRSRRAITFPLRSTATPAYATVLPDGRVVTDSSLHFHPLTGRQDRAR
jgi:prepilin-type N-terminal cleavage/methylation domain-containing protein